jgi:hypothetical protein
MRKTIFAAACILVAAQSLIAQESNSRGIKYGLQIGAGASKFHVQAPVKSFTQQSSRPAIQILGFAQVPLGKTFFTKAELGMSVKGGVEAFLNQPMPYEVEHTLTYGQLNALFGARVGKKWQISGGLEFGLLLDASSNEFLEPNPMEIAGTLQCQYSVKDRIGLGLRATRALSRYFDITYTDELGNTIGNGGYLSQSLTAFVAVQIGKGK